eukprot:m51a1_g12888 hypothetical protein (103) ;mRNA; f:8-375
MHSAARGAGDSVLPRLAEALPLFEGCDSMRFSVYVNVAGEVAPCSFVDGLGPWAERRAERCLAREGVDFSTVWRLPEARQFREMLGRSGPCQECWRCDFFDW